MTDLKKAWHEKRSSGMRIRAAAQELGVSEGVLIECDLGAGVTRLKGEFDALLTGLAACGPLKVITRNEACVSEKTGEYLGFKRVHGPIAILNNPAIDLRLFMNQWARAYAVAAEAHGEMQHSLQFFDSHGRALHKVYVIAASNAEAFHALIASHHSESQGAEAFAPLPEAAKPAEKEVDQAAFLAAWGELKDTHDFHGLLRRFGVGRTQALRLGEGHFTRRLNTGGARAVLEWAAKTGEQIMIFVGNHGAIQIHTGPIGRVVDARGWLNVMDPEFELHLKEEMIFEAWSVRKPTVDGDVNALELYDQDGESIAQFFGARKPGKAESSAWRGVLTGLKA